MEFLASDFTVVVAVKFGEGFRSVVDFLLRKDPVLVGIEYSDERWGRAMVWSLFRVGLLIIAWGPVPARRASFARRAASFAFRAGRALTLGQARDGEDRQESRREQEDGVHCGFWLGCPWFGYE